MASNCIVYFEEIEYETDYRAIIKGYSAQFGSHSNFEIEYTGADLVQNYGYIPDKVLRLLKIDLNEILQYGPFQERCIERMSETKSLGYTIDGNKARKN